MSTTVRHLLTLLGLLNLCALAGPLFAGLVAGPMLSHVDMREAEVWVQTDSPAFVRIAYSEATSSTLQWSIPVETQVTQANTATITLDGVEPGKTYSYRVEVNGTLVTEANTLITPSFYHERQPPPDFRIAIGGAHYQTEPGFEPPYQILGSSYGIFKTLLESKPELMIWTGNTAHLRQSDWSTQSGHYKRFSQARQTSELKPLLASIPHYATWGSADYAFNNSGKYYSHRHQAESCFKAFWPRPVEVPQLDGIATRFRRADVDFFLLDVRSYRDDTPHSQKRPEILGTEQIEWLRQELVRSSATFKIIIAGAPILNPADSPNNLSYATDEQTRLLEMLRTEKISGLFFISGGKYHGELTRLVHVSSYNLYDLSIGPLTANPKPVDELNYFRMPGTNTLERQFALIDFTGPEANRQLTIRVMSIEGKELWNRTIRSKELQPVHDEP